MFSIIVLTKNEERDLPGCLESVSWCDDVHIFDSFSADATIDIARMHNAKVLQHEFTGYASQRNAALALAKFKYPWVFFLDADERIPTALVTEIEKRIIDNGNEISAFSIRRKDYLNGVWLKHAQITPYYIRCFKPTQVKYIREINEVIEVAGKTETVFESFNHYPFSKGYSHWLNKHNVYSTMEAIRWVEEHETLVKFSLKKALFGKSLMEKRFHQKGLFYKIPGRPLIKWIYIVFYRRAILDGWAGLTYASLQSIYEYFIVIKTKELLENRQ